MTIEPSSITDFLADGLRDYSKLVKAVRDLTMGKPEFADIYKLVRNSPTLEEHLNVLHEYDQGNYDYGQHFGCSC